MQTKRKRNSGISAYGREVALGKLPKNQATFIGSFLKRILVKLRLGDVLLELIFGIKLTAGKEAHPFAGLWTLSNDGFVVNDKAVKLVIIRPEGDDMRCGESRCDSL